MDVTVIVPCYNSEKTIEKCLVSLINQTIEIQIIVVNDGSTDNTLQIATEYERKYDFIKVLSHENIGLPQSRKAGLNEVYTKYTAFVDSDDWVEKDMFETLLEIAEKNSADISSCELFYDNGKGHKTVNKSSDMRLINNREAISLLHKRTGFYTFLCNKLFLTSVIKQADFPSGNFLGEDYYTLLSCIRYANKIAVSNQPLYHYIIKPGSMSKSGYNDSYKKAFETYRSLFDSADKQIINLDEMADYLCLEYSAIYVAMIRNSNYDNEVIIYIRDFLKEHLKSVLHEKIAFHFKVSIILIAFCPNLFSHLYKPFSKLFN